MTMREGDRWICSNNACRCEVLVVTSAGSMTGCNPTCSCGSPMRKAYETPRVRAIHHPNILKEVQNKFFIKIR